MTHIDQSVLDGHIAMGVVLHGVTDDVGHLGETSIVGFLHGMEDAALHGLEAVVDVGHRAVEDDIGGIVNPIILEHAAERHGGSLFFYIIVFNFFHNLYNQ